LTVSLTAFSILSGLDIIVLTRPSNKSSNSAKRLGFTSLAELEDLFDGRVNTIMSNPLNIENAVKESDLVIGAVLIPLNV
jgi:hypothetical protein